MAMRSGGNFSPEWGYLAPAPSFLRTARIVVAATAIGATAGAGVVLSLIEHPAPEVSTAAAAAHAIVTSAQAVIPPAAALPSLATKEFAPAKTPAKVVVQPQAAEVPAQAATTQPVQPAAPQLSAPQIAPTQSVATQAPATPVAAPAADNAVQPVSPSTASVMPAPETLHPAPQAAPSIAALTEGSARTEAAPEQTPDASLTPVEPLPPKKPVKHGQANAKNKQPPNLGSMLRNLFSAHSGVTYYPNR